MDLSIYKSRIVHDNSSDAFKHTASNNLYLLIDNSPAKKNVIYKDIDMTCIMEHTSKEYEPEFLFKPDTVLEKGEYITLNDDVYIILDAYKNDMFPVAKVRLCNVELKFAKDNCSYEYKSAIFGEQMKLNDNSVFAMAESKLSCYVKYDENTNKLSLKDRFIINSSAYEVISIDKLSNVYNGVGCIEIKLDVTEITDTDDVENGIPDESGNSGWGDW